MDNIIQAGKALLDENSFNNSKLKVWQIQAKRVVEQQYDGEVASEFNRIFSSGMVIRAHSTPGDLYRETYRPRIQRGIDFLESLQSVDLPQPAAEEPAPSSPSQSITVKGGTVVFGDHATVNNITVKEVLSALEKDIEDNAPENESKSKALSALRSFTSNETVSAIVSQTLGAFLAHSIR